MKNPLPKIYRVHPEKERIICEYKAGKLCAVCSKQYDPFWLVLLRVDQTRGSLSQLVRMRNIARFATRLREDFEVVCQDCQFKYNRKPKLHTTEEGRARLDRATKRALLRRRKTRDILKDYKQKHVCQDCGSNPDPGDKNLVARSGEDYQSFTPTELSRRGKNPDVVLAEAFKYDVLCRPCMWKRRRVTR